MDSLEKKLTLILQESINLKNKFISDFESTLDYLAIYTKSDKEYEFYSNEALKLGSVVMEDGGIIVKLKEHLNIESNKIDLIKICTPKEIDKLGYADFSISDFTQFEEVIQNDTNFRKMDVPSEANYILYGLELEEEIVNLYFPSIPLSEDIEKLDKEPENEDELIVMVAKLEKDLEDERNKKLSLMADFHNYQNRIQQEKSSWGALANIALIQDILEIYDDIELAMNDENLDLNRSKDSLKSAQDKIIGAALKAGVERIDVKVGEEFDKERMEAVSTIPAQDENQKGKVIAVISSAYKLTNKEGILKPAKVIVGK